MTSNVSEADTGKPTQGTDNQSGDALIQLLNECAVDTGVADLAHQHDHYLYSTPAYKTTKKRAGI